MEFTYFEGSQQEMVGLAKGGTRTCPLCGRVGLCFDAEYDPKTDPLAPPPPDTPTPPEEPARPQGIRGWLGRLWGGAPAKRWDPMAPRYMVACWRCLREGRFGFQHETEAGTVTADGRLEMMAFGVPLEGDGSLPTVTPEAVVELARTPSFSSWQDPFWLVHCNDFMVYLGEWEADDFRKHTPDGDGKALFLDMTDWNESDYHGAMWDALSEGRTCADSYYAFRCRHCGKLRGYWDSD